MNGNDARGAPARAASAGLGTFAGVFTPSILTILGIVLFLRLGYVVGGSGLAQALVVIAAANAISIVTAVSVAAIATNMRVRSGGDYYLISRTLGPAFGGAIGLVLFLAQAVSIGFYSIGFAEAALPMTGLEGRFAAQGLALAVVVALGALAWAGADLATRFQYVVMALLVAGIASFVAGALPNWEASRLAANWPAPPDALPFWAAFAIFFPAVTGFTQGVSMSGDLAQPSRSIPNGVFAAVALSLLIYFGVALLFAAALPVAQLREDTAAMRGAAAWAPLVDMGVLAATLSSALASFLGAPRILQSLARDEIFPWLRGFAAVDDDSGNPRRAVAPTFAVAVLVVLIGELDRVAAVVSMFFLVSYGLLNVATYAEARAGSPSFRPTFRGYDRRVALAGALACLGAMLAIDAPAGAFAATLVYAAYRLLRRRRTPARWADGRRAVHLQAAREHLLAAAAAEAHPRDWRPQLLVFSDSPYRRERLLQFAAWVEGGAGLTTVVRMIVDDSPKALAHRRAETERLAGEIRACGSSAFALVLVGSDPAQMVSTLVQGGGIGPVRINTAIANWPQSNAAFYATMGLAGFGRTVALAFRLGTNLILLDADAKEWDTLASVAPADRLIDVWWRDSRTGELMLLLAYLMTRSDDWADARIRLIGGPEDEAPAAAWEAAMRERLDQIRIPAEIVVVPDREEATVVDVSGGSAMVFLPFRIHAGRFYSPFGWEVGAALPRLPIVALVMAAQDVDLEAEPDLPEDEPAPQPGTPAA